MVRRALQQAGFAVLRAQGRSRMACGVALMELGPSSLTCVLRLPIEVSLAIAEVVRGLPGAERHYAYPATDLHLTILNLGQDEDRVVDLAGTILGASQTIPVRLRGLGMSHESVFVRAFDEAGGLLAVRRQLMAATGARPTWPRRHLGFVNVIRYREPDVGLLRDAVRDLRGHPFGGFEATVAEIVRTDRVLSAAGTTLLRRTSFGGAGAGPVS